MKKRDKSQTTHPAGRRTAGRAQGDHVIDPYQRRRKPHEPTHCPDCGAIFHEGRWQWRPAPPDAQESRCPACRRIADDYPAGIVRLNGRFVAERKAEILQLVHHQEEMEKQDHPLNRIMKIEETDDGIEIATTDIHLPRRLGDALHRAFHGQLNHHYDEEAYFIRVEWAHDGSGS